MNLPNRILISCLFISLISWPGFSQEPNSTTQKDEIKTEQSRTAGLRKVASGYQRHLDIDIIIDEEMEVSIESAVKEAMEAVDVALENLEFHFEPIEIDLRDLDIDIDPVEINIPNLDIDIEPVDVDFDEMDIDIHIDEDHFDWENDDDQSFDKDKEKIKEKDKLKDKSDKEDKDKSKGLKKIN